MPSSPLPSSSSGSPLPAGARGAQSIERAALLLRLVAARHAQGAALGELVQASGLDRTTCHRMLTSLARAGLLQRDDARAPIYRLGLESMALGLVSMQRAPLLAPCVPLMKMLARRTDEPVFLVVRSGDRSHCLHLEEGPRPVRTFAETVGSLRLLGLGVPSFVFLARMADEEVAAHHERHAAEYRAHRLSLSKLQRWVQQSREQGHVQIHAQGIGGVGVGFALGSCGEAALGIVAPVARMARARGPALAALLQEELRRAGWPLLSLAPQP